MTKDEWLDVIDSLPADFRITFTGGEPVVFMVLRKFFKERVKNLKLILLLMGYF